MPFINLIQEQRLAVKRDERRARSYFFGFAAISAISAIGYLSLLVETEIVQSQETKLHAQIQKVKPLISHIEANEKQYAALSPRVKTLEDAQKITAHWDRVLIHLSTQTPAHTWVTAMRCAAGDPEKPISVSFIGIGAAQEPVGEMILRLQNSPDLENVQLKYTQEKVIQQSKGIEFEISADIAGTAEKKAIVKQEDKS